jgi:hypothetical protein
MGPAAQAVAGMSARASRQTLSSIRPEGLPGPGRSALDRRQHDVGGRLAGDLAVERGRSWLMSSAAAALESTSPVFEVLVLADPRYEWRDAEGLTTRERIGRARIICWWDTAEPEPIYLATYPSCVTAPECRSIQ